MALPEEKVEAVKKISKAFNESPSELEVERVAPNKEHFDALMGQETNSNQQAATRTSEVIEKVEPVSPASLMDEVKKLNSKVSNISRLSPEDLRNQAKEVIAQIDDVKTRLSNTQTDIKPSYQTLLENRLTHVDDNLRIALNKAGVEYTAPQQPATASANPIERFLGFLTHSQYQLEHLQQTIEGLGLTKSQFTPANMLTIQLKMNYAQQQIELFTNLLNKALESTKTIMNVQV